ncbi:MAG: TolC family protein [Ignavibacteriales bacterium]|nr:TolC family protein [Ignavibacteriales bacterium]
MRHLCIFALAFLMLNSAFAQDTLTVRQAVQRVLERHPAIDQATHNVRASEARVRQSTSATYPEVSGEAGYVFLGPIAKLAFPGFGEFRLYPADNYDAHIAGRYTVYDFGRTDATVNVTKSRVQSGRDDVELTKSNLAYQTIRVFYSILYLERSIRVQDEQIEALRQHTLSTNRRVDAGTATNFDVLTTQVRVAAAQSQKIDLENGLQKQRVVLGQLLGLAPGVQVPIRGDFEITALTIPGESLFQTASQRRMEIRLAKDAEQSAELQRDLVTLGDKPSLKANLVYGLKNGLMPNLDALRGNWVAGVKAEVPIFNGWRTDHQKEEAEAVMLAEQARRRDVERQVSSDVEQASADVQAAVSKITISELQVQQAKEAVSIAQSRYETGTVTNLDLLDAQAAESTARLGNLQALYKYVMSKYELQRAIGAKPWE